MSDDHSSASRADIVRERTRDVLDRRLGIDDRALAAFRITLGFVLLFDVVHRVADLHTFYTDGGALPRALLFEQSSWSAQYSIHALSGALWVQAALFATACVLALSLILGYRTKLVTVLSLVLLVSVQFRNPHLLNGGDRLLRELLVLSLFLPLGRYWAVDARDGPSARGATATRDEPDDHTTGETHVANPATAAVLVYVVAIFLNNATQKLEGDTWTGGEALGYALRMDHMTVFLGNHLVAYPLLLEVGTYTWLGLLVCSPLLLVFSDRLRTAYVSLFVAVVAGMAVTMAVGLFPALLFAALLLYLPSRAWDTLESLGTSVLERVLASAPILEDARERVAVRPPRPISSVLPRSVRRRRQQATPVVVGGFLIFVSLWSVGLLGVADTFEPVDSLNPSDHQWGMYAPDPGESYGWYVVSAELEDGEAVDILREAELETDRPPDASETLPSFRWRQYLNSLHDSDERVERFTEYGCSRVDEQYDTAVETVTVTYTSQEIDLEDTPPDPSTTELGERSCADEDESE